MNFSLQPVAVWSSNQVRLFKLFLLPRSPLEPLEQALTIIPCWTDASVTFPRLKHWPELVLVLLLRMYRNLPVSRIKQISIMHLLHHLQNMVKSSGRNFLVRGSNPISIMRLLRITQHREITLTGREGVLYRILCHTEFAVVELRRYLYPIAFLEMHLSFFAHSRPNLWNFFIVYLFNL